MSEQAPQNNESYAEQLNSAEHVRALPTAEQAEALRPGEADPVVQLEQARQTVETVAETDNPIQRLEAAEKAAAEPAPTHVNRELQTASLRRELQQIRRQLPTSQRWLSQAIHQPVIRVASEATGRSLGRPSGLLGAGLAAFIGSSMYLYLAKHIGFTYNYGVFLALFVAGFIFGLVLEILVWSLTRRRVHN